VIIIGSGVGGLTAGALLAHYGRKVLVLESHYATGGAAHGFQRKTDVGEFRFDTGPSFFAGLTTINALNPLAALLELVGEPLETIKYDPLGTFHVEKDKPGLRRHADLSKLVSEVERFSPDGAKQLNDAVPRIREMYKALSGLPTPALRADWKVGLMIVSRYMKSMSKLGPYAPVLPNPTVGLLDFLEIKDPWMRRLADLECYLLSGVDASGTVAAEFAAVFGASDDLKQSEFPKGGAEAITDALARAITKNGGEIRLKTHVDQIVVENNVATGVRLKNGDVLSAATVMSNASVWDTYSSLIPPGSVSQKEKEDAMGIPCSESFMHLHLGIKADGLDLTELGGHHVVVRDETKPIDAPGNVCMISIASVWEPDMAPEGHHALHAYTMEPFEGWERGEGYEERKRERSDKLYQALERVIPDIRERVVLEMIGSPLTHKHWMRRHKGTYGAAIRAPDMFPGPATGIEGLYRVGDSCAPGVGLPAAASSGVIAANTLVGINEHFKLMDDVDAIAKKAGRFVER
jgi:phytoene dehydrogenase-like protein|tara:strand:+ start:25514 stop:27073 length:1560 start_codon:yes stop_codon:yes gene_type:complete